MTIVSCRRTTTPSGNTRWEYNGRSIEGEEPGWLADNEMLQSFTPLHLDGFIALSHLYNPQPVNDLVPVLTRPRALLPRGEALALFPM